MASTHTPRGWFKSSYSDGGSNNCVEVCPDADAILVRHSKAPEDGIVRYSPRPWAAFLAAIR
jgi:hypothetical protein